MHLLKSNGWAQHYPTNGAEAAVGMGNKRYAF